MVVSQPTFAQVALEDPSGHWELHCGRLRQKPALTYLHNHAGYWVSVQIAVQIDRRQFDVRFNAGHLAVPSGNYYIPDVIVIPAELAVAIRETGGLETYSAPLPLVVEVWSPSTGDYDNATKLQAYQERGDREIWLLHPMDRTLIAWRRQPDGSYVEALFREGTISLLAVPGVTVDLDGLFAYVS